MNASLEDKVKATVARLRETWRKLEGKHRFVAFSTGKDSLAVAAMLYEAVGGEHPPCLYAHHDLEFPEYEEYAERLKAFGFAIEIVRPFLEYFELIDRGIGFLTLKDAWCRPLLIGTGLFEWLQKRGARSPRAAVMFRGMSGSEYSRGLHAPFEIYQRLNMPCFNPLLDFSKNEVIGIVTRRYGLPLNPRSSPQFAVKVVGHECVLRRRFSGNGEQCPPVAGRAPAHVAAWQAADVRTR